MKKFFITFLIILLFFLQSFSIKTFANYIDNDPNLIWKDLSDKVYLDFNIHHTQKNTLMLVRSPMSYWESDYGNFNPSEIVEIDLTTGKELQSLFIPEDVLIRFYEYKNRTFIVAYSREKVMIFNGHFKKIEEFSGELFSFGFDAIQIKDGVIRIYDSIKSSTTFFDLNTLQETDGTSLSFPETVEKDYLIKDHFLLLGDNYMVGKEDAELVVDLSLVESDTEWDLSVNWDTYQNGYIFSISNYSNNNYLIQTDFDGNIIKTYQSKSSEFLSFQNSIVMYSIDNEYWIIDKETFDIQKSIPTQNNINTRFFGKVVNGDQLALEDNGSFDVYDKDFNVVLHYENKDFYDSFLNFTDKYFYNANSVVNKTTLEPVYYSPFPRFHVFGDYIVRTEMKYSKNVAGGARIYKIPKTPTENIVKVDKNKIWKITFSHDISLKNKQVSKNAFSVIQSTGDFSGYSSTEIENNIVFVHPPTNGYNPGLYYLYISDGLEDENDKTIKEEVIYPFVVE